MFEVRNEDGQVIASTTRTKTHKLQRFGIVLIARWPLPLTESLDRSMKL